eukprot:1185005-Prorocentrum_minimum.AAC.2
MRPYSSGRQRFTVRNTAWLRFSALDPRANYRGNSGDSNHLSEILDWYSELTWHASHVCQYRPKNAAVSQHPVHGGPGSNVQPNVDDCGSRGRKRQQLYALVQLQRQSTSQSLTRGVLSVSISIVPEHLTAFGVNAVFIHLIPYCELIADHTPSLIQPAACGIRVWAEGVYDLDGVSHVTSIDFPVAINYSTLVNTVTLTPRTPCTSHLQQFLSFQPACTSCTRPPFDPLLRQ